MLTVGSVTSQAPCYAALPSVSPVRMHSPVRYIPAPRICRARVGIQPGRIVPAQRLRESPQPSMACASAPQLPG